MRAVINGKKIIQPFHHNPVNHQNEKVTSINLIRLPTSSQRRILIVSVDKKWLMLQLLQWIMDLCYNFFLYVFIRCEQGRYEPFGSLLDPLLTTHVEYCDLKKAFCFPSKSYIKSKTFSLGTS